MPGRGHLKWAAKRWRLLNFSKLLETIAFLRQNSEAVHLGDCKRQLMDIGHPSAVGHLSGVGVPTFSVV